MDYDKIQEYLEGLLPARPPELAAMEAYGREHDFPIIGPVSGQLCYLVARLIGATRIFELGSGYGYSTAWFAQAVTDNLAGRANAGAADAVVHHTVWDDALSSQAQAHMTAMGFDKLVRFHNGEAVEALTRTDGLFDIIFMDIDKEGYPGAVGEIQRKLRPGGVLIVDNVLWRGLVCDPGNNQPETVAIRQLNEMTSGDVWTQIIVPVRDGVLVARFDG